jgi:hypothetical protein
MEHFETDEPYDLALCVFTVTPYLLDDGCVGRSLRAAATALKPGGLLVVDVPGPVLFQSYGNEQSGWIET